MTVNYLRCIAVGIATDPPPTPPGNEVVEYFHLDALGSVRLVTAQDQHVIAAYDYLPFGGDWPQQESNSSSTLRFAGKERDTSTAYAAIAALDYSGARYYQSQTGRFMRPDLPGADQHLEDPQSWNLYAYTRNNPLGYIASSILEGSLVGPGLDSRIVHMEQSRLQDSLNAFSKADPQAYATVISKSNALLNSFSGFKERHGFATDKAYFGVLNNLRQKLGRDLDFARQSDREAIGNALIQGIRDTGGCDVGGERLYECAR